ncbi:MAG: lysophospholipase [Anaerolineae bacterium]|nr:lysophospholipase [Anaerolineae bacterium]
MQHSTGSFRGSSGLTIYTEQWLPMSEPGAVVMLVHGLGEHIGRYHHVAAALVEAGWYAVYGLDHQGHGKSEGLRAYFPRFDDPVNDLKQYVDQIRGAHPRKPVFMYGHSLGSLITLTFALRFQSDLAGLVISGTPLNVEQASPKALVAIGAALNAVLPKLAFVEPIDATALSSDTAVSSGYDADPLVYHGKVRVRMAYQIVQASRAIKAGLKRLTLPILIFHGEEDRICPPGGSTTLYEQVGSGDKTLKLYPGLRHETHNELEQDMVLANVVKWLNERCRE